MRLILVALTALVVLPTAATGQNYRPEKLNGLCRKVYQPLPNVPRPYSTWVEEALHEAAGANIRRDSEAVARSKIQAFVAQRLAMGRRESGLYCDQQITTVFEGSLLSAAVYGESWREVEAMVRLGIDPNWADPKTGKTPLDEYAAKVEREMATAHRYTTPTGRIRFPPRNGSNDYWRLRRAGLRHSGEAPDPVVTELCPGTAADVPAPGVPFTGRIYDEGSGPTPDQIPGVRTVSARQVACLINTYGSNLLNILAAGGTEGVPRSYGIGWAGGPGDFRSPVQRSLVDMARTLSNSNDRPILVYCAHEECRLSYNVLLRLKQAGYTNLYWMRSGLRDWTAQGLPLLPVTRLAQPQ